MTAVILVLLFPFTALFIPYYCRAYPFTSASITDIISGITASGLVLTAWAHFSKLRRQHRIRYLKYRLTSETKTTGGQEVSLLNKLTRDLLGIQSRMEELLSVATFLGTFQQIEDSVRIEGRFFHLDHPLGGNLHRSLVHAQNVARRYDNHIAGLKRSVSNVLARAAEKNEISITDIERDFNMKPGTPNLVAILTRNFTVLLVRFVCREILPDEKEIVKPLDEERSPFVESPARKYAPLIQTLDKKLRRDVKRCIETICRYRALCKGCLGLLESLLIRDYPELLKELK
jgi:hypothetical protein